MAVARGLPGRNARWVAVYDLDTAQAKVAVEEIEAAVLRHYMSRAGDPHRHLQERQPPLLTSRSKEDTDAVAFV
jgi:hypothetical protein